MRFLLATAAALATGASALVVVGGPGAVVYTDSTCALSGAYPAARASVRERRVAGVSLVDCGDGVLSHPLAHLVLPSLSRVGTRFVHVSSNPYDFEPSEAEMSLFGTRDPVSVWCLSNIKIARDVRAWPVAYERSTRASERRYGYRTDAVSDDRGSASALQRLCQ